MNICGGIILTLALLVTGCASLGDAAQNLLVLRATYAVPAQQAGVLSLAEEQANRLDDALASADIEEVRSVLISMRPIYDRIRSEIDNPTPEQREFHSRAVELWDYLETTDSERLRAFALEVLVELVRRVP